MKTVMLSPELNNDKENFRRRFQVGSTHAQDHGTKGTQRSKKWFGPTPGQELAASIGKLTLAEQAEDALAGMSSAEIDQVASELLEASGFDVGDFPYTTDYSDVNFNEYQESLEEDVINWDNDVRIGYAQNAAQLHNGLRTEIAGALNRGAAVNADPEHIYEGVVSEDQADFLSGFSITGGK